MEEFDIRLAKPIVRVIKFSTLPRNRFSMNRTTENTRT